MRQSDCTHTAKTHQTQSPPATESLNWTYGRVFLFWLPLALTWLMMAAEGPFLSAVIARMAEPEFNLAAYGVAFSIALMVEAPIIMIMSAATALVRDRESFSRVKRFTYSLNAIITALMLLIVLPPVFSFIAEGLINLPPHLAHLTHISCVILLPWPGVIGYRRFYQGVLIRNNRTRYVAYGTILRLSAMAGTALILHRFSGLAGAHVGAAALSAGVSIEAAASRIMAWNVIRELGSTEQSASSALTYRAIAVFYLPLALTTILALGIRPMVTFFMSLAPLPVKSLAVFPVVHSLTFLFTCLGLSFQEVTLALVGDRLENYFLLRRFAFGLGTLAFVGLGCINFTPLASIWFQDICGLSSELTEFAILPAQILTVLPCIWVWLCFQRAILMNGRRTGPITTSTGLQVILVLGVLLTLIKTTDLIGIIAASIALLLGSVSVPLYLFPAFSQAVQQALGKVPGFTVTRKTDPSRNN